LSKKVRFPIKFKLILLISFMILSALSVYLLMAMDLFKKDKSAYIYDTGLSSVETLSHEIGTILSEQIGTLKILSKIHTKIESDKVKNFELLVEAFNSRVDLADFLVLNREGKKVYQVFDPTILEQNSIEKDYFLKLAESSTWPVKEIEQKDIYIKNMVGKNESKVPHLILGFFDPMSKNIYLGRFDVVNIINLFKQNSVYEIFAVDSLGRPYAHKSRDVMRSGKSLLDEKYIANIIAGDFNKGVKEVKNKKGESLLVSFVGLNKYNLYLISQISKKKAFLSLDFLVEKSLYAGIFIVAGALLLVVVFARRFSRPIENLSIATSRVASGDFTTKVDVNSNDELGVLSDSFNHMSTELQRYIVEVKEKAELEKELEVAHLVQDSFFPTPDLEFKGVSLAAYYKPASTCGGDWWGFIPNKEEIVILIGDATGHGVPSALITATVNSAAYGLKESNPQALHSPARIMTTLNKAVYQVGSNILMTFFVVVINTETKTIRYSNAGHNPPIFYTKSEDGPSKECLTPLLGANGQRLGIKSTAFYNETEISFKDGDGLYLFTDGVLEGKNDQDEEWGNRRFLRILGKSFDMTSRELSDLILEKAFKFFGDVPPDDDITSVTLKFNKPDFDLEKTYLNKVTNSGFSDVIAPLSDLEINLSDQVNNYSANHIIIDNEAFSEITDKKFLRNHAQQLVVLSKNEDGKNASEILGVHPINHLIGQNSSQPKMEWELIKRNGNIDIDDYVNPIRKEEYTFKSSENIDGVSNELLDRVFEDMGMQLSKIQLVLNELVTNAIYNAPVDANLRPKYKTTHRKENFELLESEFVEVTAALGGNMAYMTIKDQFGRLDRDTLTQYIARGFEIGHSEEKDGGAGLGLFLIFSMSNQFIVKRKAGQWQEITIVIEHLKRNKNFQERISSFHYFEV